VTRIPEDAFARYVALGPERSYDTLARQLGVTKRTITRLATKENWQERLTKIEAEARNKLDQKLGETLQEINARHLKIVRAIQAKALQTLQSIALNSGMDAVRALDIAIKHERLIFGEPSERTTVSVEEACRSEFQRWMSVAESDDSTPEDAPTGADADDE